MSDWDYGRENGLWGNDGIPYSVKHASESDYKVSLKKSASSKRYNGSEQHAYNCGFKAVDDENAYNGRYFIKNGKKWIHNLKALKSTIGISNEYKLKQLGYDVDSYYKFNN
jgi:hypothetical protein